MFDMQERNATPIYEQIVDQMKALVARNVMQPGEKVPSLRELSALLVVNPNTVSKAYQELERQGVIETIRGKGTFIAASKVPGMAVERMTKLKEKVNHLAVEAKHLGLEREEFIRLIEQISHKWWGNEL